LYNQYGGAIFGIISRIIKDGMVAEEVLQQTMLKAWKNIDLYNPDKSSLYTWLHSIARNSAIDKVRLKSYQNQQKTDTINPNVHEGRAAKIATDKIDVDKITASLDEKYKVVLDKMYLEGYSQREIADELDIPLGTVKTRLRKAILFLREELKGEKALFIGMLLSLAALLILLW